jgi:hypothetical protein
VLGMSDEDLNAVVDHWYVPGRKMRFVRRNALVALGNTGGPEAFALIERYTDHEDEMLVRHAMWARNRLESRIGFTDPPASGLRASAVPRERGTSEPNGERNSGDTTTP